MKYKQSWPFWLVIVTSLIYKHEYYFQKYFDTGRTEYFITYKYFLMVKILLKIMIKLAD